MRKRIIIFLVLVPILLILYVNKYIQLEYNINIFEYIKFSSNYTEEEMEILNQYKPLIYGGNINEPPLGIYYEKDKQYTGLAVDYVNALSIELETPIINQPMVWTQALKELQEGKTNLCDMIPSLERSKTFTFSSPIYQLRGILVVKKSNTTVFKIEDLKNATIAVQEGDYAIGLIPKNQNLNIICTDNLNNAINLLSKDEVDAVIGDEPVARYYLNELFYFEDYRIIEKPIYDTGCAFALPKSQEDLARVVNKAIFNMKRKGIFDSIESKWAGHHTSSLKDSRTLGKSRLNQIAFILITVIIIYLIYLWNRSLKLLVYARTRELNTMKNEMEVIFDGIENYLVVIDKNNKIKNINNPFIKFLKRKKESIIESLYIELPILKELEKTHSGLLSSLLKNRTGLTNIDTQKKYEFRHNNFLYESVIYPLQNETTDDISILLMITDITYKRIQEQKLIHTNKMETIGQLAAGVAHELRNPLGIIRNSAFILNKELGKKEELIAVALSAIDNSVNRAGSIIDNLLKFSRLTHETKECINLRDIIGESIELNRESLNSHNIFLDLLCDDDIIIYMNNESLKHILMNLIQNAIDAVSIKDGKIQIVCFSGNGNVIIEVKDNGAGIDENKVDKIFEPFYTTKSVGKGTGLGLYIAYSEVKKINGEIRVESKTGIGTTFTIYLPIGSEKCEKIKATNCR